MVNPIIPTIIIDRETLFREGLRRILVEAQFNVFWCDDAPPEFPIDNLTADAAPLVIVGTGPHEAIGHIQKVKNNYPTARIALMIGEVCEHQIIAALRQGVVTFIQRGSSHSAFISTLKLALEGASVLPRDMVHLLTNPGMPSPADKLATPTSIDDDTKRNAACTEAASPQPHLFAEPLQAGYGFSVREITVLERLKEGRSNKEIARNLGISEATVKVHVKAILRKARMRNRTQVAMWALQFGAGKVQQNLAIEQALTVERATEH